MDVLERAGRRGHHVLSAAVVADGAVRFGAWADDGHPEPDEHTLFEIGSITKALTGILLAGMHLCGEVDLGDPLSLHLPDPRPCWRAREPTLLELATHRSGLPNTPSGMGRAELLFSLGLREDDPWRGVDRRRYGELVRATSTQRRLKRRGRYSSLGFGLLGDALAAAAGKPYGELLAERVLAPLGMAGTAIEPARGVVQGHSMRGRPRPRIDDPMPAAGMLASSAADMATLLAACLAPSSEPPGPALAFAQRPAHVLDRRMSVGLGWLILKRKGRPPVIWHNGATWGFSSVAGFCPANGRAAVVLANTKRPVDRIGLELLDQPEPAGDSAAR